MHLFIKEYINKINLPDIINFGKLNNIDLSKDEANILLSYLLIIINITKLKKIKSFLNK